MAEADVFVFPSLFEGSAVALITIAFSVSFTNVKSGPVSATVASIPSG